MCMGYLHTHLPTMAPSSIAGDLPRVTMTRPPVVVPKFAINTGLLVPPLGLAYLAGSLRERGYPITIVDPVGEDPFAVTQLPGRSLVAYGWSVERIVATIPADTRYLCVSNTFTQEWPVVKDLIRRAKTRLPDLVVIVGGEHVTAMPEYNVSDCREIDFAVLGEGEETLVDLIETLEADGDPAGVPGLAFVRGTEPMRTDTRQRMRDVNAVPWPAWDLVPIETYLSHHLSYGVAPGRTMPIMATRGCPYKCTFCSSPTMWTQRWYPRDPKDVVDEIEHYVKTYRADNFDFYDLTAIVRRDWVLAFCRELLARDLKITWQMPAGTRSEAIDEEVSALLSATGHRNLVYAPESGSDRILRTILKKVDLTRMKQSMRAVVRHRLSAKLNMIIGFPQETRADVWQTFRFLAECAWIGVDDVTFSTFSPYPGSELFTYLRKKGRIREMDDEFCYSLALYGDTTAGGTYCEHIGPRELLFYKLTATFVFYALSYLFRPRRVVQTVWHLYMGNHQTRIEKALAELLSRARLFARAKASRPA
jgi:radical SAM superfamily enzyme YgiQ (UPF0313 family)